MLVLKIFFLITNITLRDKKVGGNQMEEQNKKPQTTHGSEQSEEKYSIQHFKGGLTVKCVNVTLHQSEKL
ncbi:Uncharacterised protein [Streptococcus pneumoniae]|jgi:hypothetical protein|uniref:hypothetical protein n=1 Tax=Staphylococcus epidermidis TaxID=1282 RepID=UPI0005E12F63|nr:hypothetical protein [Staphylococcus epidermidis]COF51811.1 Uncharacterised protein [Streptococcus pneumoniae]